jgi:hypothetical protein
MTMTRNEEKLQERYGDGKEQAEREAEELLRLHPKATLGVSPPTTGPARALALPAPTHLEEPTPGAMVSLLPPTLPRPTQNGRPLVNPVKAESLLDAGYAHSVTIRLNPRVVRWVAPIAVVAVFVFLFLPWTGVYPGGYRVYSQNAFQTIWGGVSVVPVGAEALDFVKPYDEVAKNRLMLLYALLVVLALVLVLAPLWFTASRVQALSPTVQSLWRWRLGLSGVVALTAFVLLLVQMWTGFGLEAAVDARVDRNLASEVAAARTPEEREKANIHRGLAVGPFGLGRTLWLHLAVFSHVLLLAGLGMDLWLVWRGTRPLPRIDARM